MCELRFKPGPLTRCILFLDHTLSVRVRCWSWEHRVRADGDRNQDAVRSAGNLAKLKAPGPACGDTRFEIGERPGAMLPLDVPVKVA